VFPEPITAAERARPETPLRWDDHHERGQNQQGELLRSNGESEQYAGPDPPAPARTGEASK
jgi:hypothetical protein